MINKNRLFVDMDGTLAVFQPVDKLETLYEEGYFLNLKPIESVVTSIKIILRFHPEIEVFILSSVLTDSKFAISEKHEWLDKCLPEISRDHRLFPPCGEDKKDFISDGVRATDFLLDDYTKNLTLWQPPARGIKLLNGINHTKISWKYDCLRFDKSPNELADNILSIMMDGRHVIDTKPALQPVPHRTHNEPERER